MIGAELRRFDFNQKYNCADMETEGLNLYFSRPWQITWSIFTVKKNIESNTRYIWWPDIKVSKKAAAITGFDFQFYKENAQDPKKVLDEFENTLNDKNIDIVSHNWLGYDSMILNVWRRALGLKPRHDYYSRVFDTLALSKAFKEGIEPDTSNPEAFLAFQYRMLSYRRAKMPKTSLGSMAKDLGISTEGRSLHDSSVDTDINIEVFKGLIKQMAI